LNERFELLCRPGLGRLRIQTQTMNFADDHALGEGWPELLCDRCGSKTLFVQ